MGFFDQLGASISKTAKEVSEGAKTLADKNRVKKDISAIEGELRSRFCQIGQKLFDETSENPDPDYADLFAAITELKATLAGKQRELEALEGVSSCPNCGKPVPKGSKFCAVCGASIPEPAAPAQPAPAAGAVCSKCGAPLAPDAVFCAACGTPAGQPAAPAQPSAPQALVCPNCGEKLQPGALFCAVCGTKAPDIN